MTRNPQKIGTTTERPWRVFAHREPPAVFGSPEAAEEARVLSAIGYRGMSSYETEDEGLPGRGGFAGAAGCVGSTVGVAGCVVRAGNDQGSERAPLRELSRAELGAPRGGRRRREWLTGLPGWPSGKIRNLGQAFPALR